MSEGFDRGFAATLPRNADWDDENSAKAVRDGLEDLLDTDEPEGCLLGAMAALMTRDAAPLAALREIDQTTASVGSGGGWCVLPARGRLGS